MNSRRLKIGIIGLRELGSTMMFWPFLWNLDSAINKKRLHSRVHVDFMVKELRDHKVVLKDLKNINVKRLTKEDYLKLHEYDLFINPFPFQDWKSKLFSWFKGRDILDPATEGMFFDKKNANMKLHRYYLRYLDRILKFLGVKKYKIVRYPKYTVKKDAKILKKFGLAEKKYVVFSPTSDAKLSSWSKEVFEYFYKSSKKKDKVKIVVVGFKKFIDYSDYNVVDLTDRTHITELLQILYFSKRNYVTETATLHLSAHMGKPTIATLAAITPWFLTGDMKNVRVYTNREICPHYPCHMKFPISICPFDKRYCLTNAIPNLDGAKAIKKRLKKNRLY
jgi:ADP-heptose:LPS heptosyltransferase